MGEASTNPPTPLSLTLWLSRHSPAVSEAAMVLFVVLAGLLAAGADANHGALSIWYRVGVAGIVLTLGSLVYLLWPVTHRRGRSELQRPRGVQPIFTMLATCILALFAFCIAGLFELLLVVAAGTGAASVIAVLVVAQPVLVGAVALAWNRLLPAVRPEHFPGVRRRSWLGLLGLAGMVVTCAATAGWMVNTLVWRWGSAGSRWPGVLIAMAVLTVTAVVCAPGIIWRTEART